MLSLSFLPRVNDDRSYNTVGRTSTGPQKDHPVFKVTNGTSYRFRIINISALAFFDFQIQGHKFTVIEADGEPHSQVQEPVDWLRIIPGMRYSIVVNADQGGGNYWIHAPMGGGRVTNPPPADWERDRVNVNAILRYDGAEEVPPTGDPPHPPTGTQFREDLLIPLVDPTPPGQPFIGGADRVFNLTFTGSVDPVDGTWGFDINGIRYKPDRQNNRTVPTLLRILSEGARNETDFPLSEHTRTIQRGEVVEISITGAPGHPFHLHGHTFYVVKGPTGTANFTSAPKRDVIASGGFNNPTVIRFVADNPGPWILHCHIELHLDTGLAMVFAEDPAGIADGPDKVEPSDEWKQLCTIYDSLNPSEQ